MAWNDALNAEWIFKAGVDIFSLSWAKVFSSAYYIS